MICDFYLVNYFVDENSWIIYHSSRYFKQWKIWGFQPWDPAWKSSYIYRWVVGLYRAVVVLNIWQSVLNYCPPLTDSAFPVCVKITWLMEYGWIVSESLQICYAFFYFWFVLYFRLFSYCSYQDRVIACVYKEDLPLIVKPITRHFHLIWNLLFR